MHRLTDWNGDVLPGIESLDIETVDLTNNYAMSDEEGLLYRKSLRTFPRRVSSCNCTKWTYWMMLKPVRCCSIISPIQTGEIGLLLPTDGPYKERRCAKACRLPLFSAFYCFSGFRDCCAFRV